MGTWKLTGFTSVIFTPVGDEPSFWWNLNVVPDSSPDLDNQGSDSNKSVWGSILVRLHTGQLYLDGAVTPTAYDDLPDDFGVDAITYEQNPPWMRNGVDLFTPNFPITSAGGGLGVHVIRGGASAYYWTIEPVGLSEYQTNQGLVAATLTLADPYLGNGYPPVYTKWNTFLRTFLEGSTFKITFSQMSAQFGAYWLWVFTQFASVGADGIAISNDWEINGTYDSYPAPVNPTVNPIGGLAFGGAATIQALTDASGIYTLVFDQYHDELYQRTSSTTSTTVNVQIPDPFFKTGYLGGR